MAVLSAERLQQHASGGLEEDAAGADPSLRTLYRVGAVSAALYVLMIIVPLVLIGLVPQPPATGGAAVLEYIASNKATYLTEFISFVGLSVPALVVFIALYGALKHLSKSFALLGAAIGVGSEIAALASNASPPSLHGALPYLSDQYLTASTEAQRASLAGAAEGLMAVSNSVSLIGVLTALGILFISLAMLRGVFSKGVAYLGIATGLVGIVSEALRDMIGPGYFIYGLLLPLWFAAVGWKLYHLGLRSSQPDEQALIRAQH